MSVETSSVAPRNRPRSRVIRWVALGIAALLLVLVVVLATQVNNNPTFEPGELLGKPVPAFDLPTLDGGRVDDVSLRGKAVIVNFWNTWCIPCRIEHPALVEFYERHRDEPDFAMVGILRDDTEEAARAWVEERGDGWTIALDPGGRAALDFTTTGQPETYAIDPDGIVVGKQLGPASVDDLEAMLEQARAAS